MSFTHNEKKAISRILADIIRANGKVDLGEAETLFRISSAFGINTQIQDEAMGLSSDDAFRVLQAMPRDKRGEVVKSMHQLADADGQLDQKEMDLILRVIHPSY